jgi:hypothetical protein
VSQINLSPVLLEGFSIKPSLVSSALKIALRGSADMEARTSLVQFIVQAHAEAERLSVDQVLIDVHELYFINSECLKSLVVWINLIMNSKASAHYTLVFLVDSHLHWQDRSILALQRMAPDVVQVANWKGE